MLLFRLVMLNKRIYPVSLTCSISSMLNPDLQQQWLQRTFHRTLNCGLRKECLLCALLFFLLSILFRFLPSTLPLSPDFLAKEIVARLSLYTLMLSSYFIRSSLLREAISTIFSSFSKTALRALKGSLFSVSIFLVYISNVQNLSRIPLPPCCIK